MIIMTFRIVILAVQLLEFTIATRSDPRHPPRAVLHSRSHSCTPLQADSAHESNGKEKSKERGRNQGRKGVRESFWLLAILLQSTPICHVRRVYKKPSPGVPHREGWPVDR